MTRMLLVSFAGYPYTLSSLMPDNGLANLAGQLQQSGHAARILDYGTVETMARLYPPDLHRRMAPLVQSLLSRRGGRRRDLARLLWCGHRLKQHQRKVYAQVALEIIRQANEFGAQFIGFKLWNGDGFLATVRIAELIRRRRPDLPLFAGGPHVDWFKAEIFAYTRAFAGLVIGEGEPAIVPLAEHVGHGRPLAEVPNLLYVEGRKVRRTQRIKVEDLDALPLPCYSPEVYPSLHTDGQIRLVTVDESRGCPGHCAFCLHGQKSGQNWRFKSPLRLVEEIRALQAVVGTRCFLYAGSNTPAAPAQANARAILEAGLEVRYACFGHFKGMGKADLKLLRQSGCRAIFFGLESGSERVLAEAMHKDIPLHRARELLRRMREAHIVSITSVIYPAPFEDERSRQETLDFLLDVRPDSVPVQFPGLIPGTLWDRQACLFGFNFPSGRAKARRKGLTYKIKLIYPPRFWAKLPYTLRGRSSKQLAAETGAFIQELEQNGLTTGVGHDLALVAQEIGMDLKTLRDHCRQAFLAGDIAEVAKLVSQTNAAMCGLRGTPATTAAQDCPGTCSVPDLGKGPKSVRGNVHASPINQ